MKAQFVFREMVLNVILENRIMWVDNSEGVSEQKIIKYVKVVADSPIIHVHFVDGDIIEANENMVYEFEVNKKLLWKKATRRQIRQAKLNN